MVLNNSVDSISVDELRSIYHSQETLTADVITSKMKYRRYEEIKNTKTLKEAAPELLEACINLLNWAKLAGPTFGQTSYKNDIKNGEEILNRLICNNKLEK